MTDTKQTQNNIQLDTEFENIVPWNGGYDTGRDVRLKWARNFDKIKNNFQNLLSSMAFNDEKYMRKDIPEITEYLLSLLGGAVFGENGFASGITGFGAKIDEKGYGEMRGLTLWEWLQVPELRYNRVEILIGDKWRGPGGGIIETCTPDTDVEGNILDTGTATLKLEDGEYGSIHLHDMNMGIYHFGDERDATEDSDDSKGNFSFAGFATSYFIIKSVSGDNNGTFRYSLRPGYKIHPYPQMHFTCRGNTTYEDRMTVVYETRTYTRMLWKLNTWEIGVQNIAMQFGDLSNLNVFGLKMDGYSMYLNSVYFTGTVAQVKPDGTPVITANDRGAWPPDDKHADYYDRFSYGGCLWLCINEKGTDTTPEKNNSSWLLQVDKGSDGEDGTSVKILGSFTDTTQLPSSGNNNGDGYLIDGFLWVWDGSKFNNVGKIQGPAGQSVTPMGYWYSGLHVPYLGVVRMGRSTYMCNSSSGTDNPPMWCWTDKDGNRFTFSDGGYVLTGGSNTSEYITIATDGTNANSIIKVDVEYSISDSNTLAPSTGWKTTAPKWENGKYIWSRTATYYSDGTLSYSNSACISGGKGIKKITEYYYQSTSATELVGGEWTLNCPSWVNGTYIWTKSVIEYTDGTSDESGEINSTGANGESPVIADMDNEMESVALDYNGLTTNSVSVSTNVSVWMGSTKIQIDSIKVTAPDNIQVSYDLETGVVTSKINKGVKLSEVSRIVIEVTASYQDQTYTRNLSFSILGVKAGTPGDNAVLYRLVPSASSIVKKKDGSFSIDSISCSRSKTIGNSTSVTTDGELKYSIDGYNEQTISNGQAISSSNINSYVTFLFYYNGVVVDKETVPLITDGFDGLDGEGYSNVGPWHTDLLVPKLGVTSMAGSSWTAKVATRNPPLWCWTDKDGNRFTFSDGGYVLTGERNSSEYDVLAQKGDNGKDGVIPEEIYIRTSSYSIPSTPVSPQSEDYLPAGWTRYPSGISESYPYEWVSKRRRSSSGIWGAYSTPAIFAQMGKDGLGGCVLRDSEWALNTEYRNDSNLTDKSIIRYIDIVLVRNNAMETGWDAYQCLKTHVSSSSIKYTNTEYWMKFGTNVAAIFTSLIIAKNAKVRFFQGNDLLIQTEDGIVDAGLTGSNEAGSIRFFTGSSFENRATAPFRIDRTGEFWATKAHIQGEIVATSGSFDNVTISNCVFNSLRSPDNSFVYDSNGLKISAEFSITANGFTLKMEKEFADFVIQNESGHNLVRLAAFSDIPTVASPALVLSHPTSGNDAYLDAVSLSLGNPNGSQVELTPTSFGFRSKGENYDGKSTSVSIYDSNGNGTRLYFYKGILYDTKSI